MPSITIHTDKHFSPSSTTHPATFGQVWFSLNDDDGTQHRYAFGPNRLQTDLLIANGNFSPVKIEKLTAAQSKTSELTQAQYERMKNFCKDPVDAGFSRYYNAITNNSLDFLCAAYRYAGIAVDIPGAADSGGLGLSGHLAAGKSSVRMEFERDAIDLDGDGIETIPLTRKDPLIKPPFSPFNSSRLPVAALSPDDGWLLHSYFAERCHPVLDGAGRLDYNADNKVDEQDLFFTDLRIWQDRNSDDIIQPHELSTLASHGITSLPLRPIGQQLTPYNGPVHTLPNPFNTLGNRFLHAASRSTIDIHGMPLLKRLHAEIALPDLRGSHRAYDLLSAAMRSDGVSDALAGYMAASHRSEQLGLLDQLLDAWVAIARPERPDLTMMIFSRMGIGTSIEVEGMERRSPAYVEFMRKKKVVECFTDASFSGDSDHQGTSPGSESLPAFMRNTIRSETVKKIELAYDNFRTDIDRSLSLATRLASYTQLFWQAGTGNDGFAPLEAAFSSAIAAHPGAGLADLIDFVASIGAARLDAMGWQGLAFLHGQWQAHAGTSADMQEAYAAADMQGRMRVAPLPLPAVVAATETVATETAADAPARLVDVRHRAAADTDILVDAMASFRSASATACAATGIPSQHEQSLSSPMLTASLL